MADEVPHRKGIIDTIKKEGVQARKDIRIATDVDPFKGNPPRSLSRPRPRRRGR